MYSMGAVRPVGTIAEKADGFALKHLPPTSMLAGPGKLKNSIGSCTRNARRLQSLGDDLGTAVGICWLLTRLTGEPLYEVPGKINIDAIMKALVQHGRAPGCRQSTTPTMKHSWLWPPMLGWHAPDRS